MNALSRFLQGPIEPDHIPVEETIFTIPHLCQLYVDEIVVDTLCVPEPMTLILLGLGSLVLLRRRRKG